MNSTSGYGPLSPGLNPGGSTIWGRSSVWIERRPVTPEVAGSNPVVPANPVTQGLFCLPASHSVLRLWISPHRRIRKFFPYFAILCTIVIVR